MSLGVSVSFLLLPPNLRVFLEGQFSGKKECDRILTVGKNVIGLNLKKGGHLLPFFVELMLDF